MICPYCDSRVKDLPDNHVCPHCGAPLRNSITSAQHNRLWRQNLRFPEPPVGVYKDAAGYLEIKPDCVIFFRRQFIIGYKRTIPFDEIYAVTYEPGVTLNSGRLCVREWNDRLLPFPRTASEIANDKTTVYFHKSKNEEFRKAYMFLKQCADIACAAREER